MLDYDERNCSNEMDHWRLKVQCSSSSLYHSLTLSGFILVIEANCRNFSSTCCGVDPVNLIKNCESSSLGRSRAWRLELDLERRLFAAPKRPRWWKLGGDEALARDSGPFSQTRPTWSCLELVTLGICDIVSLLLDRRSILVVILLSSLKDWVCCTHSQSQGFSSFISNSNVC